MTHGGAAWLRPQAMDAIAGASVLASLAVFFYTRKTDRDPRFILDLGLGYMVFTAFAIGISWHWEPFPGHSPVQPGISWLGVVVLIFAAIVPNTPWKTFVAGFVAVSMNPLGMLVARARGTWDFGPASNVLVMHYPDYLMVGVSVVISHVVTGLGRQVARARRWGATAWASCWGRGGWGRCTTRHRARPAGGDQGSDPLPRCSVRPAAKRATGHQALRREAEGGGEFAVAAHR
jgi:hypothetical protein